MGFNIPKGNTIKFWLNGEETFNSKVLPKMKRVLFFQKYNSTDQVRIQVTDTANLPYKLQVVDCEGNIITTTSFTSSISGDGVTYVYDLLFTFASLGITDQKVSLNIITSAFFASISGGITEPDHQLDGYIINSVALFEISGGITEPIHLIYGDIVSTTISKLYRKSVLYYSGVCGSPQVTYYTNGNPGSGVTVYKNIGLTMALTGYSYISWDDGEVYEINSSTGIIGTGTGFFC